MSLPNDIESCHKLLLGQQELIQQLLGKIAELEARLNQNSGNSNRPPSSDGLSKRPAIARKKGKKRGGQRGHKGKTLDMVSQLNHVVPHAPERCVCGFDLRQAPKRIEEKRQVFDLPLRKLEVTEHQLQSSICPACEREQVGQFPESVPARVQYGPGVRSLSVLLNNGYQNFVKDFPFISTCDFGISESRIRWFF